MLHFQGISKSFYDPGRGDVHAIDGITATIPIGITALVGSNGSGKTTLLRILAGLMTADDGTISRNGKLLMQDSVAWRASIGFCTLSTKPPSRMRVCEYLLFLARMHRMTHPEKRVQDIINQLEIASFSRSFGDRLSTGQAQRCILAAAIVHDPQILLLDELTTGLDIIARNDILHIVRHAGIDQRIVIFATHHPMEIERIANRLIALRLGRIVIDAPVSSLGSGTSMEDRMIAIVNGSHQPLLEQM